MESKRPPATEPAGMWRATLGADMHLPTRGLAQWKQTVVTHSRKHSTEPLQQLVEARTATTLSHSMSLPEMGNMDQIDDVIEETWKMVDLIAPIVVSTVKANN